MNLSLEHILGFKVRVSNVLDVVTEGTIYSYNSINNTLTVQTSKKGPMPQSFKIIKCSFIKNIQVIGEKPLTNSFKKQPIKPINVNIDRVNESLQNILVETKKNNALAGKGVSEKGQIIFDCLYRTFSDTKWIGKSIVVLDDVQVISPYKVANVKSLGDAREASLDMVKRIISRTWENISTANDDEDDGRKGG